MKKTVFWILGIVGVVLVAAIGYVKLALPNVGSAPEMHVELTPDRIARGEYLANHVTVCMDCHSQRDWSRFSGPPVAGTLGRGGEKFDQTQGLPGIYYAKNITPSSIGRYTDGELFRVITTGVTKEGKALFPLMPYPFYGKMDPEDIKSIIAYLRTLKPIEHDVPESKSDFPMNIIVNTLPVKASFSKLPEKSDTIAYGGYLVNAASCVDCHTPFEKGKYVEGMEFAGGREFPFPDGSVARSANITPDKDNGLGEWDADTFVSIFKARSDSATLQSVIQPGEFNSIMPWTMYGKMEEGDLRAIFAYLKTIKPIKSEVVLFTPKMKK